MTGQSFGEHRFFVFLLLKGGYRKWQPAPVFLPGESHGRRSLVGYSPRGCKESDMTEGLHFHPIAQWVKNLPAVQRTEETQVWSLGQEDLLEKEMATHSSILAWRIPWTEGPGGLQSVESQRVRHDWATKPCHHSQWDSHCFSFIHEKSYLTDSDLNLYGFFNMFHSTTKLVPQNVDD